MTALVPASREGSPEGACPAPDSWLTLLDESGRLLSSRGEAGRCWSSQESKGRAPGCPSCRTAALLPGAGLPLTLAASEMSVLPARTACAQSIGWMGERDRTRSSSIVQGDSHTEATLEWAAFHANRRPGAGRCPLAGGSSAAAGHSSEKAKAGVHDGVTLPQPTPACLHPVIGVVPLLDVLHPCTKWLSTGTGLL